MACNCKIGRHPQADAISKWLQDGTSGVVINERLKGLNYDEVNKTWFSIHRIKCLGLAKLAKGRPAKVFEGEIPDEVPPLGDIRDEVLKVFYYRIKNDPSSIKSSELTTLLTSILRAETVVAAAEARSGKADPLLGAMEAILGNVGQAEEPQPEVP